MLIALGVYLFALRLLPEDAPFKRAREQQARPPLDPQQRRGVIAILLLCVPMTLFWAGYEQQGNTIALWADSFTDRTIDFGFWRGVIPTSWFQSFNPFMIFAFTPLVVALWRRQAQRGTEPSTATKIAFGCFGLALANLVMALAAWQTGDGGKASWLWLFAYFAVITLGELYLSPTGLSLVTKIAPAAMVSLMMGIWLATDFVGNFLAGWLGSYWSAMPKAEFFAMIAGIGVVAGALVFLIGPSPAAVSDPPAA